MKPCSIEGCTRKYRARGFCSTHYYREFTSKIGANAKTIYTPREAVIDGDTARIPLGVDCEEYTIVDAKFAHLDKIKWSKDHYGYAVGSTNGKHIKLHQLIIGKKRGYDIDHINRDKLDNRASNLRHTSHRDNALNTSMFRHNTSGYRGVCWDKAREKWSARIQAFGRTIHLGRFDDLDMAIRTRTDAEAKYFNKMKEVK